MSAGREQADGRVDTPDWAAEAERQSRLLALLRREPGATAAGLAGAEALRALGLAAYRANAAATAPRALAAAYPTLARWLGAEAFAAMARAHWLAHPSTRGDLACWGDQLPEAIAQDPSLAGEPGLVDIARLDWAMHRAAVAADDDEPARGLMLLGQADPECLVLLLRAGAAVISSPYPIVEIWRAHHDLASTGQAQGDDAMRFASARLALRGGPAQSAWVSRGGAGDVQLLALDPDSAAFNQALLDGLGLADALQQAGAGFNFEAWLILALRHDALAEVKLAPGPTQVPEG